MSGKRWFWLLTGYLFITYTVLYSLYAYGRFALPWAVGFKSVWFIICGLYFWFRFQSGVNCGNKLVKVFAASWLRLLGAYLLVNAVSIVWQLWLIRNCFKPDAWDGILAGYAGLHVYEGYTLFYKINPFLQLIYDKNALLREWSILIFISLLAAGFVKRQQLRAGYNRKTGGK